MRLDFPHGLPKRIPYENAVYHETALGRIGEPVDVGKVIVNLLSEDFGWVTAQDVEVSGGHLL